MAGFIFMASSGFAAACGLYGLGHHMENGSYKIAPFKPDAKPVGIVKPKVKDRPVFATSTRRISERARQRIENKPSPRLETSKPKLGALAIDNP